MTFWLTFSASTWTTGLGYTPASRWERIVGVIGRPEFPGALYPLQLAWCLGTASLPQQVRALTPLTRPRVCGATEPEAYEDKRDYMGERAARIDVNRASTRSGDVVVRPGTGELMWEGFAPTVSSGTK